nr:DNA polymerase II large subunit [Candidatus Woesearchaeota archaeon]
MEIEKYFQDIENKLNLAFSSAIKARSFGHDPVDYVEIPVAKNIAERIEGLISVIYPNIKNKGLSERIIELEKQYGAQNWRISFIISLEVANEKFCKFSNKKEAMEIGLRVALAYITNGVVSSPLEGFTRLEIKKRRDNKEYLALYFAGPIRSAGTTAVCIFVAVSDYMRRNMGYSVFDPNENEVKRFVTELHDFHERITNLQYLPTKEEIEFMVRHIPLQIDGEPSEDLEVSNYKDIDRVETNFIRNGVCLVIGEGLTQKAAKFYGRFLKLMDELGMGDWKFLEEFVSLQKKIRSKEKKKEETKIEADYNYIKDLVAGRPILTYPLEVGGFRLRYGRARNSGLSSTCIHPATMIILNNYIGSGTQLKLERPGKSSTMAVCDLIEGPIVKINDGSVLLLDNAEDAEKYVNEIDEILFLGDILISYGDFFNRAHKLVPCGYNEEWYSLELEKIENKNQIIKKIIDNPNIKISGITAVELSKKFNVPLHPRYTYHWNDINKEQFSSLVNWFKEKVDKEDKIILPFIYNLDYDVEDKDPKRVMELLGIPHKIFHKEYVMIDADDAYVLNNLNLSKESDRENVLEIVNDISGIKVMDKSGTFIGARMGRPEKAKQRKLTGSPQVLFPVGSQGGKMRSVQSARKIGKVTADFAIYFCEKCDNKTIYPVCEKCDNKTARRYYCKVCDKEKDSLCKEHNSFGPKKIDIDVNHYYDAALNRLNIEGYNDLIKGVRGTSNKESIPENLAKGILRSKHNLYVNKDGTIRYDMTEMAITAFKPREINLDLKKLKELGYTKDIYGNDIESEDQVIELKPQDIILPACDESLDEGADKVLFNVANFIDDLLINFYKLEGFYNLKKREDLIGHLVIGLSPHTSAGIVARIIGFSRLQGLYAHPLLHCMMRRDCVYPKTKLVYYDADKKQLFNEEVGGFVDGLISKGAKIKKIDSFGTVSVENKKNLYCLGIAPN